MTEARRKTTKKYYFSVEGETEKWYLDWLEKLINTNSTSKFNVSIDSKIQKDPEAYVKTLKIINHTDITHIIDYESNDAVHKEEFKRVLDSLRRANKLGKQVKYFLGYSNFTFELWMILHKTICNGWLASRSLYLLPLNQAFNENFEDLDKYKKESNFKKILSKLTLNDVKDAINRSKTIMENNKNNGWALLEYKGYKYYEDNPSLTIWEAIDKIFRDCGL